MFSLRFACDQDGILLMNYIPKRQTIKAKYYSSLLVKDILKEKRSCKYITGVLFVQENSPAHRTLVTQKKKPAYLSFRYLDHPLYFPDPALSDYHLFSGLKKTEKSLFFVQNRSHFCCGWTENILNFWVC
jgi:hypothetical protein